MDNQVELELCANCKKEIPHYNYVMHTTHCARFFALCSTCKEPIPKGELDDHRKACKPKVPKPQLLPTKIEQSEYFSHQKTIENAKVLERNEKRLAKLEKFVSVGNTLGRAALNTSVTIGSSTKPKASLIPCQYCELELPKLDLQEHENYCGARTEKCSECGELVLFKYRQLHEDTNHTFLKPNETARQSSLTSSNRNTERESTSLRPSGRFASNLYDATLDFSTPVPVFTNNQGEKLETSREISRRLDCKTEYIRNLLHDSASITAPLRTGAVPRHHSHNKGMAPQPPLRRANPPTELVIPCEFCGIPVPHEDLIEHETGCRPDLAKYNPRRRQSSPDFFIAPEPSSPDVELPCEFCCDLIPASQLLMHQSTCT